MIKHEFTKVIESILKKRFGKYSEKILAASNLIQYLNIKTKSVSKGAKARSSYGNLYAIYVLIEDYIQGNFHKKNGYSEYKGAAFSQLFKRQRELPFGQKLQNHALNHRMIQEFKKYFPTCEYIPILRDPQTSRYWFNENLLKQKVNGKTLNIAEAVIEIIETYIENKKSAFDKFIKFCEDAQKLEKKEAVNLICGLIEPNVDARVFEIVSYSILKYFYHNQNIYWGFELKKIKEDNLKLFKTGRTNANDGGIDFVMKPLGRFFQVTETVDAGKYFLDIDKIEKYPITFVIKSTDPIDIIRKRIEKQAQNKYSIKAVVSRYMASIEEIINIPTLLKIFKETIANGYIKDILSEIIKQSKVEFHYDEESGITDDSDEDS